MGEARWRKALKAKDYEVVDGVEYELAPRDGFAGWSRDSFSSYAEFIHSEAIRLDILPRREATQVYLFELEGLPIPYRLRRRAIKIGTTSRGERRITEVVGRTPYQVREGSVLIVDCGSPDALLRESAAKNYGLPLDPEQYHFSGYTDVRLLTPKQFESVRQILLGG